MGERQAGDPAYFFETHVFICTNRREDGHKRGSCAAGGSEKLKDYMKARVKEERIENIRINAAACLDRCELGPCAVIYPEGVWYKIDSRAAVDEVIARHIEAGGRAEALMIDKG
jgi:(2Fe-2S) ferredoxin